MILFRLGLSVLLAMLLFVLLPPHRVAAQGRPPVVVAAHERVRGDLATIDQAIIVAGVVEGDVTSWSGTIQISGTVLGDVVSYSGVVELTPTADVHGNVLAVGGQVVYPETALVAGQVFSNEPLLGGQLLNSVASLVQPAGADPATPLARPLVSGMLAMISLLLIAAALLIWPRRMTGVSLTMQRSLPTAFGVGLLSMVLLGALTLVLSAVLALSLIGLPLILPLLLLAHVPLVIGVAVVARTLGERLLALHMSIPAATLLMAALLLLPLVVLGSVAPLLGGLSFYALASAGLGAMILSRGGVYVY
jgi:cytoskeletal protein CcmA (bactofilin family)